MTLDFMRDMRASQGRTMIERQAKFHHELNRLTDEQIAELLLEEVWGAMSALDDNCTLVNQAIERLKRSRGEAL